MPYHPDPGTNKDIISVTAGLYFWLVFRGVTPGTYTNADVATDNVNGFHNGFRVRVKTFEEATVQWAANCFRTHGDICPVAEAERRVLQVAPASNPTPNNTGNFSSAQCAFVDTANTNPNHPAFATSRMPFAAPQATPEFGAYLNSIAHAIPPAPAPSSTSRVAFQAAGGSQGMPAPGLVTSAAAAPMLSFSGGPLSFSGGPSTTPALPYVAGSRLVPQGCFAPSVRHASVQGEAVEHAWRKVPQPAVDKAWGKKPESAAAAFAQMGTGPPVDLHWGVKGIHRTWASRLDALAAAFELGMDPNSVFGHPDPAVVEAYTKSA
ncbi:hypothetical protein C8R47DRAFT_1258516 [Mycena vitilis]|nr:hypothetical protein C8R47DRAFT_1258516 [Mycena vitilis]